MKFTDLFQSLKNNHSNSSIYNDMLLIYEQEEFDQIILPNYNVDEIINEYNGYPFPTVSCGIIAFNEERCINRCIESLDNEFDEIILLDGLSTDNTINIVQTNFPIVRVHHEEWRNDFSFTRNKLMEYCNSDWIYFIDADNVYSKKNKGKMKRIIKLIDFLKIKCVLSPVIKEHNGHIYTDNRKILKNGEFLFKGKVHEEPFFINGDVPLNITADLLVYHDGYDDRLVNQKNKNKRNLEYTKQMIKIDSENPKWLYFYARELEKETGEVDQTILMLEKAIYLYESSNYQRYRPEAIIFYCQMLLKTNSFTKLISQVEHLEKIMPNCIDTEYYRAIVLFYQIHIKLSKIASVLENSLEDKSKFSIINYSNEHIYSLLSQIYLSLSQPKSSIENYKKIKFEGTKLKTRESYNNIIKYLEEVIG